MQQSEVGDRGWGAGVDQLGAEASVADVGDATVGRRADDAHHAATDHIDAEIGRGFEPGARFAHQFPVDAYLEHTDGATGREGQTGPLRRENTLRYVID